MGEGGKAYMILKFLLHRKIRVWLAETTPWVMLGPRCGVCTPRTGSQDTIVTVQCNKSIHFAFPIGSSWHVWRNIFGQNICLQFSDSLPEAPKLPHSPAPHVCGAWRFKKTTPQILEEPENSQSQFRQFPHSFVEPKMGWTRTLRVSTPFCGVNMFNKGPTQSWSYIIQKRSGAEGLDTFLWSL